jgi:hypothetical protein
MSALDRAKEKWGDGLQPWVILLAQTVDNAGSQSKVATALNLSAGTISQVISNTYKGDLAGIEKRVMGKFGNHDVECPVLGTIGMDRCMLHQSRKADKITTNSQWVRLYRACPNCPNRHLKGDAA